MSDKYSDFQLIEATPHRTYMRAWTPRLWATVLVALTLVLGAWYAPLLWSTEGVTAGANQVSNARFAEARSLQMEASLVADQEALANLYSQIDQSVVSIQVTSHVQGIDAPGFKLPPGFELPQDLPPQQGQGSGFIYDNEGHIVTNNHVVDGAEEVTVVFYNNFWAKAEVVATDPQADLAVIKVTPPANFEWQALPLANPENLHVGHTVIAIGNPFGLGGTMTTGIVSAVGRGMPVADRANVRYTLPDVIQTDAAINPGNSGGPLLNLNGEIVGVNFAIESPVRSNSGVGFAIPVSILQRVVPALITDGKFDYPFLGLSGGSITPQMAAQLELKDNVLGVYVSGVERGGPSDKAGIQGAARAAQEGELGAGGDIITAIDNQPVARFEDLVGYLVTKTSPGQTVTLTVLRDGAETKAEVVLGTRPDATAQQEDRSIGAVSAREALAIALDATKESLAGDIIERTVTPDERDGLPVWVVQLSTDSQTATVVIDRDSGNVLEVVVE